MTKTEYLRISNRGSNLFQQQTNTTYAVNFSIGLRNRVACIIDCIYSTVELLDLALDTTILEVGLRSNINIAGYDTQTSGSNSTAGGYKIHQAFDLDNELRTNGTHDRKLSVHGTKYPFTDMYCSSLQETIQFGLYKIDSANSDVKEKLTNAGYIGFTLKIQFLE